MKNVARFRRQIKKILRTICILGVISALMIPSMAVDNIETIPLHKYYAMRWLNENYATPRAIAFDNLPSPELGYSQPHYRAILEYQSALNKDTFYHMRLNLQATNNVSKNWLSEIETGQITQQGGEVTALLLSANDLSSVTTLLDQSAQTGTNVTIDYSYERMMTKSMTTYVGAKAYYYFTKNSANEFTIDMIFYFNDEFFTYGWNWNASATRYMQCYLGIMMPLQGNVTLTATDVYPVGGTDYNGKLDQIIALLQAQGGGLTEEDIKNATVEAMRQHEQEEKQQGQHATQDTQQQAEQALTEYTATFEDVMEALNNLNSMFSYEGTDCVLSIPAVDNPMTGGHYEGASVDLATYYNKIPIAMRSIVRIVFTFAVYSAIIRELYNTIRKMTEVTE